MRSSRLFRRIAAGLCAAAMLCGGMAAAAAAPALPAAPAAAETTNASPSDAELKAAFSMYQPTVETPLGWLFQVMHATTIFHVWNSFRAATNCSSSK